MTRFSPRRTTSSLQNEVNRLFEDFFPTRWESDDEPSSSVWSPRVDIAEGEDEYTLHMDLPGVPKDNVTVSVEDGTLKVSGERKMSREERDSKFYRIERSYGRFYRSFDLGSRVDPAQISAEHEDGVLTIHVPKTEESKPQQIEIK